MEISPDNTKSPSNYLHVYILAGIGFAFLIGWELSAVFSPSLPLLSFCETPESAVILRIVSISTLAATFVFCFYKADWLFVHRNRFLTIGSLLALFTVVNTLANLVFPQIPFIVSIVAWAVFGMAQASIMMYWCIFFSLIPTKRTAVTIGLGSCFGTALFIFVNAGTVVWLSLVQIAFLIGASVGLALLLSKGIPSERILPVEKYNRSRFFTIPSLLSVGCHGAVYGFMSIMICSMGSVPALITGASGIIGTLFALLWGHLGPKVEIDIGIIQRISLPLLIAGLLLFPFFGYVGRIVCGCIVNTALAHSSVNAWYSTSIDNAEFQLHPVDRFAIRQAPTWTGFLIGSAVAYVISFMYVLSQDQLYLFMVIFALVVVIVFSIYGGNESKIKKRLNALLNSQSTLFVEEEEQVSGINGQEKPVNYFQQRCEKTIRDYNLTPREAEVFLILAKGRNAGYISNQLVVSSATVKSHIYHIYRKLGINSQQHLMNIVDDMEVD